MNNTKNWKRVNNMLNEKDLGMIFEKLVELRNRTSPDGSNEVLYDDHLLLDWLLDTFEFIFGDKVMTKGLKIT